MESTINEKVGLAPKRPTQLKGYVPRRESYFNPLPHIFKSREKIGAVLALTIETAKRTILAFTILFVMILWPSEESFLAWPPNSGSGVVGRKSDSTPNLTLVACVTSPQQRSICAMDYRIICTVQEPLSVPTAHAHIVEVGTGTSSANYNRRWTVDQVYTAMADGHTFHTFGTSSGIRAEVEPFKCSHCGRKTLRSKGDVAEDNNLDNLPRCS